jgi:DAK2 domain fusion protein YloV
MTSPPATLSGPEVRELFAAGMTWLERHVDRVNAVNVFPVPDGDTGTNMFLTMRSTLQEADACEDESAGVMLAAMAHGALMGARGNSGVILSQIIRGVASAHDGKAQADSATLTTGLEEGALAAYKAVTSPAEGTILTVVREAAEAARAALDGGADGLPSLMSAAVVEARASVERTPSLLPQLAEAGVVDAGGLGLLVLLEGMLRYLSGEPLDAPLQEDTDAVGKEWLAATEDRHATGDSLYGYCTEVLVSGTGLQADSLREQVLAMGDSVLVVGDNTLVRIHVHTDDPGAVLTCGTAVGNLIQVKVDNIRRQAESFVEMHEERHAGPAAGMATVAVVAGEGMAEIFESEGCMTVSGGPTMNPSTGDIVRAIEACSSDDVIVLPNDKNIIMAAQQAVGATAKRVHVVPSRSMPQGLAALLAVRPEADVETNIQVMSEALQSVRTIEITRAVRTTSIKGVAVKEGQIIAIVDDELKLAAATPSDALLQVLPGVTGADSSLVTLYRGAGTSEDDAGTLAEALREALPAGLEVAVHYGGEPHYDYIVSVE